ncbi:hypothetical protein EVAR_68876_1 [Eumeta japonica]|uniref:Uncharacterized protein n=1 Tax=Eumeta variegata TaxID=151549 RepID=A0A4C1ZVR3_EUMVA|nr:hypothetical protein EVAR_68876_1 [Eumeta japonica]
MACGRPFVVRGWRTRSQQSSRLQAAAGRSRRVPLTSQPDAPKNPFVHGSKPGKFESALSSARNLARVDFEHIPLPYVSTVYDPNPNSDFDTDFSHFDFDRSLAFNSQSGLGLSRLGLRSPAVISDLATVPYSDSEHALGSNFISTLDSNHGSVLDSVLIRSRLPILLFVLFAISIPLPLTLSSVARVYGGSRILFFSPPQEWCPISRYADGGLEVHSVPLLRQPQPPTFLLTYLPALPTAELDYTKAEIDSSTGSCRPTKTHRDVQSPTAPGRLRRAMRGGSVSL